MTLSTDSNQSKAHINNKADRKPRSPKLKKAEAELVPRGRINQLENAEIHDAITLRTLKETANALECELIYAIVPKGGLSLEDVIRTRAEEIAKERVARIAHSMSLEAQSIDTGTIKIQKDELTKSLIEHLNKKFWATPNNFNCLIEAISIQMQKNKKMEIPIKKGLINDPIFTKKLKKYLIQMQEEKNIHEPDLLRKLKDPEYINALKNALIRYQKNNKKQKTDLFQKLIENLKKKK